jgi:SOS-response transcriptional repressor LexA
MVPWTLRSRALEVAGYLPGDVLIVDLNARPDDGDVVCAQVYERDNAETLFRIYEAPYLQAATYQRGLFKPLLVDGRRVVLRGVVVASIRPRLSQLAPA